MRAGPPACVARLPPAPGVYRFRDGRGHVLYIGRAVDLRRRVASYWGDLRDRRHLLPMVIGVARVEAVVCDSEHEAAWLESNLLERRLPPWNRTDGWGVPVYVRLDPAPAAPGLSVVHELPPSGPARHRHFGPYLGAARARLAVSAVERVLPLPYAGEGSRGFQRDMARVRCVGPADREALVQRVIAVLDRDPAAVAALREELGRRRDRAADGLAFELAARLQAEIEALDWITSEQKAALLEPLDLDVNGWAGGVLVRFEVRRGRLEGWSQRACAEPAARRLVAATPAAWTGFARRNAELAARLAQGTPAATSARPARA